MRILTWNINGVRTLPQYHPWNTLKDHDDILNHLQADIICFQEMKTSRPALTKPVAVPPSYTAFFSFPIRKSGYSGVATYVRNSILPLKAEEGLTGFLQPKPVLGAEERISSLEAYPQHIISDEDDEPDLDYKDLDSEGRAIIVDFGMFVLINVYCPNDGNGTEERDKYKADFHRVLEARVRGLVEHERRDVIVVGDLNACAAVMDHCEGKLMIARGLAQGMSGEDGFWGKDVRRWLRDWMVNEEDSGGPMVDIVRRLWPNRMGMYTCWNTKISARESNYGTRIDYILITQGLLPWVKGADIQPEIKGSDHCPVWLDLYDEITDANGRVSKLQDALGTSSGEPPRFASKFWDEHSGKQMLLQNFFGRKGSGPIQAPASTQTAQNPEDPARDLPKSAQPTPMSPFETSDQQALGPELHTTPPTLSTNREDSYEDTSSNTRPSSPQLTSPPRPLQPETSISSSQTNASTVASSSKPLKRKLTANNASFSSTQLSKKQKSIKPGEKTPGQTKLSTFFAKPKGTSSTQSPSSARTPRQNLKSKEMAEFENVDVDEEADHQLALLLSQDSSSSQRSEVDVAETKQAWTTLLAPLQPPICTVHRENCKEFTVNKPGPNKGKKFFVCARPVGPGYDKGRTERLREHVDPTWRCNFFKWSSEVRKEMRKGES